MFMDVISETLARRIQHTLYGVGLSRIDVERHCEECLRYGFGAAMVPARWVAHAAGLLHGSPVDVATAVDFPLGLMTEAGREREATAVVEAGADEIDIGVAVGLLHTGDDDLFHDSIRRVVVAVEPVPVKVMLELPLLTQSERERAVDLAVDAGAAYLKNASSGRVGEATPADIRFLRERAPSHVKLKASGAIHTAAQAQALLEAGADVLGTSSGVAILTDADDAETGY